MVVSVGVGCGGGEDGAGPPEQALGNLFDPFDALTGPSNEVMIVGGTVIPLPATEPESTASVPLTSFARFRKH